MIIHILILLLSLFSLVSMVGSEGSACLKDFKFWLLLLSFLFVLSITLYAQY